MKGPILSVCRSSRQSRSRLRASLALVVLTWLALSPQGADAQTRCEDAFVSTKLTIPRFQDLPSIETYFLNQESSVKTVASSSHPKELIEVHRTGRSWFSQWRISENDIQGDPRWFAFILGSSAAQRMGFRQLSESVVTVPTVAAFNRSLNAVDAALANRGLEKTPVRFFETNSEVLDGPQYLRIFANRSLLPIAREGHLAVHDWAYHASTVFFPPSVIGFMRDQAKFTLAFHDQVSRAPGLTPEARKLLLAMSARLTEQTVNAVDSVSGNLPYDFIRNYFFEATKSPRLGDADTLYEITLRHSVDDLAQSQVGRDVMSFVSWMAENTAEVKTDKRNTEIAVDWVRRFYRRHQPPAVPAEVVFTPEGFYSYVHGRIREIREAALEER